MAEEFETLPVDEPETAIEVEGVEPEIDEEDDETSFDPAGEPDEEAAALGTPAQAAQPNRANDAIRAAKARAKAAEAKAESVQREMMELLRGQVSRQNAPAPIDPAIERQRLELMSEDERTEYRVNKALAPLQAQLAQLSLQNEISNDRAQFSALVNGRPELKKYEGKVEERFQQLIKAGSGQSRESILKYILGEVALTKGGKAMAAARATGAENIRRQQTRPTSARSNVSDSDGHRDDSAAAEERLRRYFDGGGSL